MEDSPSSISKDEPIEVKGEEEAEPCKEDALLTETQPPAALEEKKTEDEWTTAEVQLLQSAIRIYLQWKTQRDSISKLVVLPWLLEEESVTVRETENISIPILSAEAAAKRDTLPPFAYPIKVLGGDAKPPVMMSDNSVYVGQLKEGRRFGKGICYSIDGGLTEGYWSSGLHLMGRIIFPNGDHYEGEFVHGKKHGQGKFLDSTGTKSYEGGWDSGLRHGHGIEKMNGGTYEGNFEANSKKGLGRFVWPTGEYYTGNFLDDRLHGWGKYVWNDTKWYDGDWFEGMMHGKGFLLLDGKEYKGDFVMDKKQGMGVLKWNGNTYRGEFESNKMHGKGWLSQNGRPERCYIFENNKRGIVVEEPDK